MTFTPKTWRDYAAGATPIVAAELNRLEQGIDALDTTVTDHGAQLTDLAAHELRGTGMPNGVVTAPPGTYYTDTAGTNGAWRWLKRIGTGNTGWDVVHGNTGWRNIPMTGTGQLGGTVWALRTPEAVYLRFTGVLIDQAKGGLANITVLPAGFDVGYFTDIIFWLDSSPTSLASNPVMLNVFNGTTIYYRRTLDGTTNTGPELDGTAMLPTTTAWPTTLPAAP